MVHDDGGEVEPRDMLVVSDWWESLVLWPAVLVALIVGLCLLAG